MKILGIIIFFFNVSLYSQVSQMWFDTTSCGSPINYTYTYSNWSSGSGSGTTYGYTVYRNGTPVRSASGSMSSGRLCKDIRFINDSVGVIIDWTFSGQTKMYGTKNYGFSWIDMGFAGSPTYLGLYILNQDYVYSVTWYSSPFQIWVAKCSMFGWAPKSNFIYDANGVNDIYKTDTIAGPELCGRDSLKINLVNNGDTIVYHINWNYAPVLVKDNIGGAGLSKIYPNPNNGIFAIDLNNEVTDCEINLLNSFGQIIYSQKLIPGKNSVSINKLPTGFYHYKIIKKSGETASGKIIIE